MFNEKETQFKALMHNGEYVDMNSLERGILYCSTPFIFDKDETIENLVLFHKNTKNEDGELSEDYFSNLEECELVDISIFETNKAKSLKHGLSREIEKIIDKNITSYPFEGDFVDRYDLQQDILDLIKTLNLI